MNLMQTWLEKSKKFVFPLSKFLVLHALLTQQALVHCKQFKKCDMNIN